MAWLEKRSGRYRVCYRDAAGKVKRVAAYTDKLASKQMLADTEKALARGEQGLVDPFKKHKARPLAEHVADYLADLRSLGRDDKYVYNVGKRLDKLLDLCGWRVLGDVSADSFGRWRERPIVQRGADSEDGRVGPRTLNQYLEAARTFLNWGVKRGRLAVNPLAGVEKVDETADVRRARRALSVEQLTAFFTVVPPAHQLIYRFVAATGLRRQEVADLVWGDLHLASPTPFITLRAASTKSRRADTLPLRPDVAGELAAARGSAADGDPVFDTVPDMNEHRSYLAAAGIPWTDDQGRRADFHALRHTYGTLLSQAGVSPREAMELMRHTDLRLTMKVYTDPRIFDLAGAVGKLRLPAANPPTTRAATGTDGQLVEPTEVAKRVAPATTDRQIPASTGTPDGAVACDVTGDTGEDWQQKTPSDKDGVLAPQVGLEASFPLLARRCVGTALLLLDAISAALEPIGRCCHTAPVLHRPCQHSYQSFTTVMAVRRFPLRAVTVAVAVGLGSSGR